MKAPTLSELDRSGMVILGDSAAEGRDDPAPTGGWIGWARRLAGQLEVPEHLVVNAAGPGATAATVAAEQLREVQPLRPRLVALSCGVNDVMKGYDAQELVGHLDRIFGWARVVGATVITMAVPVPPILERPIISELRRKSTLHRIDQFNQELARFALVSDGIYAGPDAVSGSADPVMWSADGIHLNSAGHAYAAGVLADSARDVLGAERIPSFG